jgi:hypothetical protein
LKHTTSSLPACPPDIARIINSHYHARLECKWKQRNVLTDLWRSHTLSSK